MDVMLVILILVLSIFLIYISQYLFEKNGIIYIYIIYNIVSFLMSFKILEILEININANIVISTLVTSLTYLIIEKANIKEYKNIIKQTFIVNIIVSIILWISSLYIGSVNDINSVNMKNVFLDNYKILISYPIITLINQSMILLIYNNISDITKNPNIRMMLTNLTSLMIETILFSIFSYIFKVNFIQLLIIIVSNYLIKVLISLIYTPFISYIIKLKKVKLWIYYYYL